MVCINAIGVADPPIRDDGFAGLGMAWIDVGDASVF